MACPDFAGSLAAPRICIITIFVSRENLRARLGDTNELNILVPGKNFHKTESVPVDKTYDRKADRRELGICVLIQTG
ncbi:hypothetical protein HDF17_002815 [Granulicella arctica]|uniref:Uncharacterized protein n=1 Tax=Granulicella arctica TaxID=940613 RepID=A0A7Y9PIF2_9BACT|nr:hypothetical protein [Granulicella arctica]